MDELEEAIDRVIAGTEKKSRVISDFEKRIVAFHEAGHAVVGYLLPLTDPVHKVSIIPRGRSGGYTLMLPEQDRYYMTKSELLDRVTTLLSGRVAEQLVLNDISTGAQNDLERSTQVVRQMITEYGMSDELGPITLGRRHEQQVFLGRDISRDRDYSDEIAHAIDKELRATIDRCYHKAQDLLEKNRDKLDLLAQALLQKETLDAEEITALMEGASLESIMAKDHEKKEEEGRQQAQRDADAGVKKAYQEESGVRITVNDKDLTSKKQTKTDPPK
jgi:cell division protease FtsH